MTPRSYACIHEGVIVQRQQAQKQQTVLKIPSWYCSHNSCHCTKNTIMLEEYVHIIFNIGNSSCFMTALVTAIKWLHLSVLQKQNEDTKKWKYSVAKIHFQFDMKLRFLTNSTSLVPMISNFTHTRQVCRSNSMLWRTNRTGIWF